MFPLLVCICTMYISSARPQSGPTIFPNSTTSRGPSVQTHDSIAGVLHLNYNKLLPTPILYDGDLMFLDYLLLHKYNVLLHYFCYIFDKSIFMFIINHATLPIVEVCVVNCHFF